MIVIMGFVKPRAQSLTCKTLNGKRCRTGSPVFYQKEKRLFNLGTVEIPTKIRTEPAESKNSECEVRRKIEDEKNFSNDASLTKNEKYRKNAFNIQMLSKSLHSQIFGNEENSENLNLLLFDKAKGNLKKLGLWRDNIKYLKNVSLDLPPLRGSNIEEHFMIIGKEQALPYKNLLAFFIKNGIPTPPSQWLLQKGWTKYVNGEEPISVPFPDEDAFVFDVEVNVKFGQLPTLATAVSSNAWYGWISSNLSEKAESIPINRYTTSMLIPFEGKTVNKERPRIIIGHNVSYDRARIKEQYYLKNSALRFLDTMSVHICIGGLAKNKTKKLKKNYSEFEIDFGKELIFCSLKELYHLYCNKDISKDERNIFVEGSLQDVRENFQALMSYCANDVIATYEVLQVIFPIFLQRFPHPVTLAGMLEMGSGFLCVNNNFNKYLSEAEQTYEDINGELSSILSKKCDNACKLYHNEQYKKDLWMWSEDWTTNELKLVNRKKKNENIPSDIQNEKSEEENELKNIKKKFKAKVPDAQKDKIEEIEEELIIENKLKKKFQHLFSLKEYLPKKLPILPGYPSWYRKLCANSKSSDIQSPKLSTSLMVTPKLLNITWENFPLFHSSQYGWGILIPNVFAENVNTSIPFQILKELTIQNCNVDLNNYENLKLSSCNKKTNQIVPYYKGSALWCNHVVDDCCYFFKLPRGNNFSKKVGNPLSKEYSYLFNNGILNTEDYDAAKVINLEQNLSYWRNNRQRIINQMVVWLSKKEVQVVSGCEEDCDIGIIIPLTVVCGTMTRRAMESTWLVASKTAQNRIGSELRSMVQSPAGYHFVGADVDSQELWIASLIGDAYYAKEHGCTPFGWMTLIGTKSNGTDMHSVVAKEVGISRENAKVINYARIYGGGVSLAQNLLKKANPTLSEEEAREKALKMYTFTKGRREYKPKKTVARKFGLKNCQFDSIVAAQKLARKLGVKTEELFEKPQWVGGTESAAFNQLEQIAGSREPVTPFLQGHLTRALEAECFSNDALNKTRINWVVQSGAVDFLHLLLVCMKWLTNGKARYCFSFHDEFRYLVPSEDRYNVALALQASNLLVRSFCSYRVGIYDLPQSVAFFSSVEIDKSLRKEPLDNCVTTSNPHGLEKNYGIPPGESLDIYETVEKSGGNLSEFCTGKKKEMSQATKRKHVCREVLEGDLVPLKENQLIVKVLGSRGSNLHEVETPLSDTFLVSMPSKFRKNVWIKRGDYVLVEPIEEGGKVKGEIVNILTSDYIKYLKKAKVWPVEFSQKLEDEGSSDLNDDFLKNNNRKPASSSSEVDSE